MWFHSIRNLTSSRTGPLDCSPARRWVEYVGNRGALGGGRPVECTCGYLRRRGLPLDARRALDGCRVLSSVGWG
eukprot:4806835-Pyramimonas_sp.AAC.1